MLILYRIKRKVLSFHLLKKNFTNLLAKPKPFLAISDPFVAWHGTFQIPIDVLVDFLCAKLWGFLTRIAHFPATCKQTPLTRSTRIICDCHFLGLYRARDFGESPSCNLHN